MEKKLLVCVSYNLGIYSGLQDFLKAHGIRCGHFGDGAGKRPPIVFIGGTQEEKNEANRLIDQFLD